MSSTIKVSLLDSLYRARKNIERNKDIYMDSEHELLCEYYKKYQEQSKKFQNDKIKTTFNTFKIEIVRVLFIQIPQNHAPSGLERLDNFTIYLFSIELSVIYNIYVDLLF